MTSEFPEAMVSEYEQYIDAMRLIPGPPRRRCRDEDRSAGDRHLRNIKDFHDLPDGIRRRPRMSFWATCSTSIPSASWPCSGSGPQTSRTLRSPSMPTSAPAKVAPNLVSVVHCLLAAAPN